MGSQESVPLQPVGPAMLPQIRFEPNGNAVAQVAYVLKYWDVVFPMMVLQSRMSPEQGAEVLASSAALAPMFDFLCKKLGTDPEHCFDLLGVSPDSFAPESFLSGWVETPLEPSLILRSLGLNNPFPSEISARLQKGNWTKEQRYGLTRVARARNRVIMFDELKINGNQSLSAAKYLPWFRARYGKPIHHLTDEHVGAYAELQDRLAKNDPKLNAILGSATSFEVVPPTKAAYAILLTVLVGAGGILPP